MPTMIPRKPGRSGHCIGVRVRYRIAFGPRAGQRKTLERLCRYITRPALANDRVQMNASGQVELKPKRSFSEDLRFGFACCRVTR